MVRKSKQDFKETTIRIKVELKDGIHKVEILCGNAGWLDIIRPMLNEHGFYVPVKVKS